MPGKSLHVLVAAALLAGCSQDPEVAKREYLRSGDRYVAEGKPREAIVEYLNAVQQDPQFGEARLKLAETYLEVGDVADAAREFVRAADALPGDVDAQLRAGELLLLARQFDDARSRADKALAADPARIEAHILRANALAGLSRIEAAVDEVEQAIRTDPDRSASYASLGAMQLLRGDRRAAEEAFQRAAEMDPRSLVARLALANFYLAAGRGAEAEAELKHALAIEPRHGLANRVLAYFYVSDGRPALAEPHLQIVAEVSSDVSSRLMLANYYVATRRLDEARAVLETAASLPKGFVPARLRLAGMALAANDFTSAADHIQQVLAREPTNPEAFVARSQLELATGKLDAAFASVKAAQEIDPGSPEVHYARGRVHVRRGEHLEAISAWKEALRLNPRFVTAELELARLHLASGRFDEAEQLARSALTHAPRLADAHLLFAQVHLARAEPERAEPTLRMLAREVPDSPVIGNQIGRLELAKGNRSAARAAFARVLDRHPTNHDALAGLTEVDLIDKRHVQAVARLESALQARPGNAALLVVAGRTRAALNDIQEAEKLFQQAIQADADHLDAYSSLVELYLSQQRPEDARQQLERLAAKQPQSVPVHTTLAILFQTTNRPSDAQARYEYVLQLDPRAAVAANNLAWLYVQGGASLDLALQLAQTAKARLPEHPEVNDTLGWVYVKKGLASLAIAPLLEATEKDPRNASYQFHLGIAYAGVPDAPKARAALEKALALNLSGADAAEARKALAALEGS